MAAAVAPNKGESERYWFLGSSVMCKIGDGPNGNCSCRCICDGCVSDVCEEVWLCDDSDDNCVTRVPVRDRTGDPVGDWMIVGV